MSLEMGSLRGLVPGLAAYRRRWGARVWSWFSSPVLCCAVLSSNAIAQDHAVQVGAQGNKQATKSKSRSRLSLARGLSVLARRTEVEGQVRSGRLAENASSVCWLWAAIKNLGFCCRGSAVLCC